MIDSYKIKVVLKSDMPVEVRLALFKSSYDDSIDQKYIDWYFLSAKHDEIVNKWLRDNGITDSHILIRQG